MIVGNGLIGQSLFSIDRSDTLFFASGVSDSKCTSVSEYLRETKLIEESLINHSDKLFVYFSTYSIDDTNSSSGNYVKHKINVENLVRSYGNNFLIIRASNLLGRHGNPKNVVRFFYDRVFSQEYFECWEGAFRNILDIEHFVQMVDHVILEQKYCNTCINIVNPNEYAVPEIIRVCETICKKKGNYRLVKQGSKFHYNTSISKELFQLFSFSEKHYLENVIKKYLE